MSSNAMIKTSITILALVALMAVPAAADDGWSTGRATFYGRNDGFSVHQGSCGFGQLDAHMGTGLNIAALSDKDPEFSGSCGSCYEVACNPGWVSDGYGQSMDRNDACRGGSVVVKITDSCPCYKPENQWSNRRWCCGDQRHFDLSWTAFEKIGNPDKGVIPIKFRKVACPTGQYWGN